MKIDKQHLLSYLAAMYYFIALYYLALFRYLSFKIMNLLPKLPILLKKQCPTGKTWRSRLDRFKPAVIF